MKKNPHLDSERTRALRDMVNVLTDVAGLKLSEICEKLNDKNPGNLSNYLNGSRPIGNDYFNNFIEVWGAAVKTNGGKVPQTRIVYGVNESPLTYENEKKITLEDIAGFLKEHIEVEKKRNEIDEKRNEIAQETLEELKKINSRASGSE